MPYRPRPTLGTAVGRALSGRCPNCGQGRLFASFLKQVQSCPECDEAFGHIRSDDAAPWLTILVVGHVLIPVVLMVEREDVLPYWFSMTFWPLLALAMSLAFLPKAKALFLGVIWSTKAQGSEAD